MGYHQKLTFVVNGIWDDRLEREGERALLVALEEDLEAEADAVQVDRLRVVFVGESG